MPEFVIEKRNIPVLTIASNSSDASGSGNGNGSGENSLGFRITGGADFEMPITVFQVRENSPAAKAGLKLGDQIVTINGADASAMRLATAESVIKQAGEQLQLVVAKDDEDAAKNPDKLKETREIKFANEDYNADNPSAPKMKVDEGRASFSPSPRSQTRSETRSPKYTPECPMSMARSPSCESCEYTNAAVVEEQLRQMQQQLNEISIIPMQIQATLSYLTKTLAKFAPPELQRELPVSLRSSSVRETIPEESESMDEYEQDKDLEYYENDEEYLAPFLERLFDESKSALCAPGRKREDPSTFFKASPPRSVNCEFRIRFETMASLCGRLVLNAARRNVTYTPVRFCKMMNDPIEHATGLEKRELLARQAGDNDPFDMRVFKRGPGTKESPNMIPSAFESRLVGCVCEEDQTYIQWMWLHQGHPKRCECGHWFKLVEKAPV